jgi:hypothetical protein
MGTPRQKEKVHPIILATVPCPESQPQRHSVTAG